MSQALILANAEIKDWIIQNGVEMLRKGASAADVAEQVARDVEDDSDDHSVGFSGLPNVLGQVECDASFMDGDTLRAGAVAALHDFRHPISVARAVMERLPHVLLVGEGANQFAGEINAERRKMLTTAAAKIWRDRMSKIQVEKYGFALGRTKLKSQTDSPNVIDMARRAIEFNEGGDTMNVIVRDAKGSIVSAVTTSGIAWKYPGRAGDSPILGAGNYADSRHGAAACMGLGELTMRHASSVRAVMMMQLGQSLQAAGESVARDIIEMQRYVKRASTDGNEGKSGVWIRILMMDRDGNCGAFSTASHDLHYKVQRLNEDTPSQKLAWHP